VLVKDAEALERAHSVQVVAWDTRVRHQLP
jgi:cation transport ATPase